jgi:hypothetical protein
MTNVTTPAAVAKVPEESFGVKFFKGYQWVFQSIALAYGTVIVTCLSSLPDTLEHPSLFMFYKSLMEKGTYAFVGAILIWPLILLFLQKRAAKSTWKDRLAVKAIILIAVLGYMIFQFSILLAIRDSLAYLDQTYQEIKK